MQVGQTYKVRPTHEGKCENFESHHKFSPCHIKITRADSDGSLEYGIIRKGERVDGCNCFTAEDLIPYQKTLDDVEEDDVLQNKNGDFTKVLGRAGKVVFVSRFWEKGDEEKTCAQTFYSTQSLKDCGYSLVQDTPEVREISLDEVAQKFNIPVENIRIKKEE